MTAEEVKKLKAVSYKDTCGSARVLLSCWELLLTLVRDSHVSIILPAKTTEQNWLMFCGV